MAVDVSIPKLGLTMQEAVLVAWRFSPGDKVAKDQIVLVIETDKVSYEMPSPGDGLLHPIVAPGATVKVSQVVGYLAADLAELKKLQAEKPIDSKTVAEPVAAVPKPDRAREVSAPSAASASGHRIKASPLARAMAEKHGLELARITGSGPTGRIVRADIMLVLEAGSASVPPAEEEHALTLTVAREIPVAGIRRAIFQNMHLSLATQAQLTLHTEASAANLMALRRMFNRRYENKGPKISLNAIIVKAAAQALKLHPMINASVIDEVIKVWQQVNIGVAMDPGVGLVVPKVRRPDKKGIKAITQEIADLAERARSQKLMPDDFSGGTFTITNLGAWDIDCFTPIVNNPESAILGVGRIVEKMVVKNGAGVAEPRLSLSLTIDHRIIDGAPGAAFLKTVKDFIENPSFMLE